VNYVIPANDDATKTVKLILNLMKDSILEGKSEKDSVKDAPASK
jgi:ribosomal protein S2